MSNHNINSSNQSDSKIKPNIINFNKSNKKQQEESTKNIDFLTTLR